MDRLALRQQQDLNSYMTVCVCVFELVHPLMASIKISTLKKAQITSF